MARSGGVNYFILLGVWDIAKFQGDILVVGMTAGGVFFLFYKVYTVLFSGAAITAVVEVLARPLPYSL